MSQSAEILPGQAQQSNAEIEAMLAQGMSQADIEMFLAMGIDPYQTAPDGVYATAGEYQQYTTTPEPQAELQQKAQEALVVAEAEALTQAAAGEADISTRKAAEDLVKNKDVQDARDTIESIFGSDASRIEQEAIVKAIDISPLASTNKESIAEDAVQGRSPLETVKYNSHEDDAVDNLAKLEDRVDGRAEQTVVRIAKRARAKLKSFGIRDASVQKLGDEALRTDGANLTKIEVALEAEDIAIGEQVVRSITGGKPKMTKQLREKIKEIADQGQLKTLQQAVSNKGRSRGTLRRVGKQLRRTIHSEER